MNNSTQFQKTKPAIKHIIKLSIGSLLLIVSLYFIINSLHFFKLSPEELGKYFTIKWILLLHIFCGSLALLTGPFQFWQELRNKNLSLHRTLGKIYVFSAWVSGVCAIYLSFTSAYQVSGAYAFSLQVWVSVWLISTTIAYTSVRRKKIKFHKEWVVRSYLATLAFVMSALLLKMPSLIIIWPIGKPLLPNNSPLEGYWLFRMLICY